MKLICHNDRGEEIFEDGDKWIWKRTESEIEEIPISKVFKSLFPFFAVTKWRYIIDDKETFEKLKKKYEESLVF